MCTEINLASLRKWSADDHAGLSGPINNLSSSEISRLMSQRLTHEQIIGVISDLKKRESGGFISSRNIQIICRNNLSHRLVKI